MGALQESHISDDRIAEYITELQEFSRSHGIPFGQPDDVVRLVTELRSSKVFASEFGSMIRSIALREGFKASEFELLTVVAAAWGGVLKDDLSNEPPPGIKELRSVIQDLLRHGTIRTLVPIEPPADKSDKENDELVSSIPQGQELARTSQLREFPSFRPLAAIAVDEERHRGASGNFRIHGYPSETDGIAQTRKVDLSAGKIIAAGLTGLVVALLWTVASLPVYRARVSVNLPATDEKSQTRIDAGSPAYAVVSGELPGQVSELLLGRPHPNPLLKQDVLSRGMRELHLGGNQTILYADLVAETARQVKVRRLISPHVYEITCESWSAQLATTFCNELLGVLGQQPQSQSPSSRGTALARTIDEAVGPGVQVYPHWYWQSFAGLVIGCLAAVLLGFLKRAEPEADSHEADSSQ